MKRSIAGIQPTVSYEGFTSRSCSVGAFRFDKKENTVKAKSTMIVCVPAVVQASQTIPISVYE